MSKMERITESEYGRRLRKLAFAENARMRKILGANNDTKFRKRDLQGEIMEVLSQPGAKPMTQMQIADIVNIEPNSCGNLLRKLIKRGLVTRFRGHDRSYRYHKATLPKEPWHLEAAE